MKIIVYKMGSGCCSGCYLLSKRINKLISEKPEIKEYVEYRDVEDHDDECAALGIMAAPYMVCVDKAGAPIWHFAGYNPSTEYEDAIIKQVRHAVDTDANPQYNRGIELLAH